MYSLTDALWSKCQEEEQEGDVDRKNDRFEKGEKTRVIEGKCLERAD